VDYKFDTAVPLLSGTTVDPVSKVIAAEKKVGLILKN
jgi:hypothetical protein